MSADDRWLGKPLPPNSNALAKLSNRPVNIHDLVEPLFLKLYDEPEFHRFMWAVKDTETVEGSLSTDDHEAARMIRDLAQKEGVKLVAESKIATLIFSLRTVARRYGIGRKQRRYLVAGEQAPPDEENNDQQ